MNQNLIPLTKDTQRAKEVASLGGSSLSPLKKYAQRLRRLKEKGMGNELIEHITNCMEDPEYNILDIKESILKLERDAKTVAERATVAKLKINLHEAHFGKKNINKNINFSLHANINTELSAEELDLMMENFKNRDKPMIVMKEPMFIDVIAEFNDGQEIK